MDENLKNLIRYARSEFTEAERLRSAGLISDEAVFVRLFLVGKSLVGWDSDLPDDEAFDRLREYNRTVNEIMEGKPISNVS
ncbi:MAG: hypothetical protein IIZ10_09315 [Solobacterium sp.]|nr:hypothetical protein [Solobacterium sp.]